MIYDCLTPTTGTRRATATPSDLLHVTIQPKNCKKSFNFMSGELINVIKQYLLMKVEEIKKVATEKYIFLAFFKGGSSSDPSCYRPISILPGLAKALERLILRTVKQLH